MRTGNLESPRSEFLEKFSANSFVFYDAEENISRALDRGGIADLPLETLKLSEPRFWEVYTLLFYKHMQVWQLQEPFYNDF